MKNIKRSKSGFAMQYAVAFMAIAALFCALIYLTVLNSTGGTNAYAEYIERKIFLDKTGDLSIDKYEGKTPGEVSGEIAFDDGNEYGYTLSDENATVKVLLGDSAVLTVAFVIDADSKYKLSSYIYGDIYYV